MNEQIDDLLTRGVEEVIDKHNLEKKLKSKKTLRVKLGIDPTSKNIHIGRAVLLWKLRAFQELGHKAVLIVGDFTGIIGDTSDKDSERPMLTHEAIQENLQGYLSQAGKIIDLASAESHFNSDWLSKLTYLEIGKQADLFGLHEFEARENIAKRMKEGKRVSLREVLYPLMQGYDSVAVKADVELGGTDQRFNLLAGRSIQKAYNQEQQDIVMTRLLEGTDGRKMSSSWGNVINITDEPNDMFGKVMSIRDDLMTDYFTLATRVPLAEVKEITKNQNNPRDTKIRLAQEIVTLYHGADVAAQAAAEFEKVFTKKEKPSQIPEFTVQSVNIIDVMVETKLAPSRSEARRLVEQGGVSVDDEKVTPSTSVSKGSIVQVGKRKFAKIK